jgi:NO-binding membrane sensor protein with MHYT domain
MSLKAFHLIFVTASVLLAFGLAAWSLVNYFEVKRTTDLVFGLASALIGLGLIIYGRYFLKKLKHISYL